jgi:hypothetical protein
LLCCTPPCYQIRQDCDDEPYNTREIANTSKRRHDSTKKQSAQPCKAQNHIKNDGEESQEKTKQQALPES